MPRPPFLTTAIRLRTASRASARRLGTNRTSAVAAHHALPTKRGAPGPSALRDRPVRRAPARGASGAEVATRRPRDRRDPRRSGMGPDRPRRDRTEDGGRPAQGPGAGALRDLLLEQRMAGTGEGYVFGRTPAEPFAPSSVYKRAKKAWDAAGVEPIKPHDLRHTCASVMIAAGINAKALSTYLGHSSITITFDLYGHLLPRYMDEAAGMLDDSLARADSATRLAQVG